jgi:dTDP-L-rhamnose 4-epimerase
MTQNVLITGGAGFIGSKLSIELLNRGYSVTVLDNLSPQIHGETPESSSPLFKSIKDKVRFVRGSVNSKKDWLKVITGQNIIIHLAAETGTGQSMYQIQKYTETNINGTAIILDILVNMKHSVHKVILASSRALYGEGKYQSNELGVVYPNSRNNDDMMNGDFEVKYNDVSAPLRLLPTDECSKIHPSSIYGITKQNQEQMIMTTCLSIGLSAISFRYQNVYGPGQSLKNPYTGIFSIFSTQIKNNNEINIFEDGLESRDFVFIDDVVDATILGIESEKGNNNIFNVGSGIPTTVLNVANTLAQKYGINVPINVTGNYRLGDIRHNYADLSKIKRILKFKPKIDFEEGISRFVEWVNDQKVEIDMIKEALEEMKTKNLYK